MKRKVMLSLFVIFLAAAIIGGATMAWFTAKADTPENTFTAGTVMIEAGDEFVWGEHAMDNVNPGDCYTKCVQVYNTGSKAIELKLTGLEFEYDIDWDDWICENWEELCFSKEMDDGNPIWGGCQDLKTEVVDAAVYHPGYAQDDGYGPFDGGGYLINPLMAAPCPDSDWVMKYIPAEDTMEFYYAGGPIEPGESVELCLVVVFDGKWMGNLWQAATFTMGGDDAKFHAVQASNNAPNEVWGAGWNDYFDSGPYARLLNGVDQAYADQFYTNYIFNFQECCLETARVTTQEELNAALGNETVERIKLYGEFDGFAVNRNVAIQGGTINVGSTSGSSAGVYLNTNGTVVIDGVTIIGKGGPQERGIETQSGTIPNLIVRNSSISHVTTGIYLNPFAATLTATNNTIFASGAGIGTDNADLTGNVSGNTFASGVEGIGLNQPVKSDGTIMTQAEANALKGILESVNTDCSVNLYGY